MNLLKLIQVLPTKKVVHATTVEVTSLEMDSRKVTPGALFFCIFGQTVDGHQFVSQAIANGACAIVAQKPVQIETCPIVYVPDTTRAMAVLADYFYGHPSQQFKLIGITGTNGKTTTSQLIDQFFINIGEVTGLFGTMYIKMKQEYFPTKNTTPDALVLQKTMYEMVKNSISVCTMEVSSHALQLGRVHGCDFDIAVFTNLTQDHLDFHQTMDEYRFAKSLLFSQLGSAFDERKPKFAILNADDPAIQFFKMATVAHILTYGIDTKSDVMATKIEYQANGTRFWLQFADQTYPVQTHLLGKFNIYNLLAAVAVLLAYGVEIQTIVSLIPNLKGVKGRFELVPNSLGFSVVVDYAHTPDGLVHILQSAKMIAKGQTIVVIGCGGDRDETKRPQMGRAATQYADFAIFTSDNPRSEDPMKILKQMEMGTVTNSYELLVDRSAAIEKALKMARKDDMIIIAGKGHETTQIFKDRKIHFDDVEVVTDLLGKMREDKG
ncbi:MAG TPA: UDP-N-acetylmuramoyl-L-alanyl-D-glutamate--2,6-diaminopimelate ligase [Firmicutes bacterium]|nr:UDP-N-acetylmuramoyl-L-alanyl-D-glutamate--2,6-diaminopimelate ligase [Bacillota bacterium]